MLDTFITDVIRSLTEFNHKDWTMAAFELGAAFFQLFNIKALRRDKSLRGVSTLPTIFFTIWGCYNVYFYPATGNPITGIAAVLILIVNIYWLLLAYKYRKN